MTTKQKVRILLQENMKFMIILETELRTLLLLKAENIVLGGNLSALLYAYVHNFPCIFTRPLPPFRFDSFPQSPWDSKRHAWERILTSLSLSGLCPLADKATNMSIKYKIIQEYN